MGRSRRRPRRRDLGELAARLDKHIERLPDYAERAQRTIQRYRASRADGAGPAQAEARPAAKYPTRPPVAPSRSGETTGGDAGAGTTPAGRAGLPARLPELGVPAIAEMHRSWVRWKDPAARLERRKQRTSRALTLWIVLTLLCGIAATAGIVGASAAAGVATSVFTALAGVAVFGTFGVRAGLRLRALHRVPLPMSASRLELPARSSAAHRPMQRLAEAEASLSELLAQLSQPQLGVHATVPGASVAQARTTAQQAATVLRALAGRVEAVERARDAAPVAERPALEAAVLTLVEQLEDGLDDYGSLVAAAGRALAASSGGVAVSREALTDATDRLAGLAIALRELS